MSRHDSKARIVPVLAALVIFPACDGGGAAEAPVLPSTAEFAALQARGEEAMGVDQYASSHRFDALSDGGRIELQMDADDPAGIAEIRQHLQEIAAAFEEGDFRAPAFVHQGEVPGAAAMADKRGAIAYTYQDLPRGGEVRLTTSDPDALHAIHQFMAFQRAEHHAAGVEHPDHGTMGGPAGTSHEAMHPDAAMHPHDAMHPRGAGPLPQPVTSPGAPRP